MLSAKERAMLLPALQAATGAQQADLLRSFTVFELPLAAKGEPAIVAISRIDCGVHPNCGFFVFRQQNSVDVPILNSVAGDWDTKDSRHHGYRDIVLTNYQGVRKVIATWQFDGKRYRVNACVEQAANGTQQRLEHCDY
jgi:hypothetical protein